MKVCTVDVHCSLNCSDLFCGGDRVHENYYVLAFVCINKVDQVELFVIMMDVDFHYFETDWDLLVFCQIDCFGFVVESQFLKNFSDFWVVVFVVFLLFFGFFLDFFVVHPGS